MMFVIYGSIIALSWFAAHFITDGTMTTGNLTSMFSYVMSMMMALMMLSMIFVMVSMSAASARRIAEVLNEKADITNPENPVMAVPDGRIDFNHVNFTYKKDSDKDALEDIDIHINAGETIGIIGGTGCGKSSFVNLISRLYDVKDGSVCVGGIDVRDYDLETLRNEVSVVLQKNVLFSGTILDNLRWGDENASEEDCIEACRQAVQMNSLRECLINTIHGLSRVEAMFPVVRDRDSVSQERCLSTRRFLFLMIQQVLLIQPQTLRLRKHLQQRYQELPRLSYHREFQVFRTQTEYWCLRMAV